MRKPPLFLLMFALWAIIAALVLGHDIYLGRWDSAAWFLAINWASCELGFAVSRFGAR